MATGTGGAPKIQIPVTVADETASGFNSIESGADAMAAGVADAAGKASKAIDGIADKGEETAQRMDRQTTSISQSLRRTTSQVERQLAEMQSKLSGAGGAGTPAAFENLIKIKGADAEALNPLVEKLRVVRSELEQLQAVEARNTAVAANQARIQQATEARNAATQTALLTARMKELAAAESAAATKNDFINSLREQSAAIGKTRADLLELKAVQMGLGSEAAPYIAQLRAQEQAMVRGSKAVNEYGKSQGELKAALRNVPAQFTDIFVSLQTGQAPLTVLLQQGGQLKDMFGGLAPAMKAIGGYALGLINPYTLLAAAVGVLAVAYYQGSKEQDAYVKSLVLTGNAAGATAGQMKQAAQEAAAATNTTVGANAEAIAALAGTGKVSADNFKAFSQTVVTAQRDLDIPLKETIKNFEALGEEPVKASAKLNASMKYLTGAVYEQIIALEQQGKKTEAAELAQKSYSSAMDARSATLKANLGTIERGWRDVTTAAKLGWDAILNVGRAATNSDRLGEAQKALDKAQEELGRARGETQTAAAQKAVEILKQRVGLWQSDERQAQKMVEAEKKRAEASEAGVRFADKALEVRSKEKKLQDEINKVEADGLAAGKTKAEIQAVITALKAKEAKSTKGEDRAALGRDKEIADLQARIAATKENTERLKEFGTVADKVTEGKIAANKIENQLAGTEAKRMSASERAHLQRMLALNKELDTEQQKERNEKQRAEAIERSVKAQEKAVDAANKESDAIERQNENLRANIDAHGKSAVAIAKANAARAQTAFNEADSSDSFTPEMVAARQRALEAAREQVRLTQELDYSKVNEQLQDQLAIAYEINAAAREDLDTIGLTESERRKLVALRRIELRLAQDLQKINNSEMKDDDKEKARGVVRQKAIVDAETAAIKEMTSEWQKYFDDLNQGMGDAIETAIFDGSKEGAKKMRDVLEEALLRKPLRIVIDATMKEITGGILQMVLGAAGGGGGAAGGGGGLGGLLSLGSSLYQGYTGLTSGTGILGSIGSALGLGGSTGGLSALSATSVGSFGGVGSGVIGSGGAYTATAASTAGAGSLAGGGIAGLIMLAVINVLGGMRSESMIGAGLRGVLDGNKALSPWQEWREGGTLLDGSSFSTNNPLEELEKNRKKLQELRDSGQGESNYGLAIQSIVTDLEKTTKGLSTEVAVWTREINKGYKAYRSNVVDMANSLGLAGDSVKDFAYNIGAQDLNFQGLKPEEIQAKITETFGKAGADMAKGLLGTWKEVTDTVVDTMVNTTDPQNPEFTTTTTVTKRMEYQASEYAKAGETAIQTLERLSKSFYTLNEASDALGFGIYQGSLALADFADDFIEAFGGLEKFTSTTSAYLQNFYSDEERKQALLRSGARQANRLLGEKDKVTAESLEALGRDGFRAFVDGLVAGGGTPEEIRDAMDLGNMIAPAFESLDAAVVEPVREVAAEVDKLTQMFESAVKSLKEQRQSLMVDLARAKGDEVGARALERQNYLDSFVDEAGNKLDAVRLAVIATLYDGNIALKDEVDIRKQILELTQTNSQALNAQRAALNESNKALFDQAQMLKNNKALGDLAGRFLTPAQRRTAGYDNVASTLRQEGYQGVTGAQLAGMSKKDILGLWTAIYNLGETSSITRGVLIETATTLLDLKDAAATEAADALESAYSSLEAATDKERTRLEELKTNIQSVFDELKSNVEDLYGEVAESRDALAREGLRFINEAYQTALSGGGLPKSADLSSAIGNARAGIDGTAYATQFEADKARLLLAGKLSTLQEIAGDQLSEAEQQLKALEDQLVESRLLVDQARKQLDATYEGTKATNSIAGAIAELARALVDSDAVSGFKPTTNAGRTVTGSEGTADLTKGTITSTEGLTWQVQDLKYAAEQALIAGQTKQVYDSIKESGFTLKQAEAIFDLPKGSAEQWARDMGYDVFHSGINFVPETGVALLERGERVIRAADNPYGAGAGKASAQSAREDAMIALMERIAVLLASGNEITDEMLALWNQVTGGGNEMAVGVMNGTGRPIPTKEVT